MAFLAALVALGVLNSAQISSMRETCEAAMPDTATLQRATPTGDGGMGSTLTWSDVGSYPCQLVSQGGRQLVEGGKLVAVNLWTFLLPHGTDVRVTDRLSVAGLTYEVKDTDAGHSYSLQLAVHCRRLD